MRNEIYHKLKSIGFEYDSKFSSKYGIGLHYKYYPNYLGDNHYTLVIFILRNYTKGYNGEDLYRSRDFRLYVHAKDGSFVKSHFQIDDSDDWNKNHLNEVINEIFYRELRQIKLKRICK